MSDPYLPPEIIAQIAEAATSSLEDDIHMRRQLLRQFSRTNRFFADIARSKTFEKVTVHVGASSFFMDVEFVTEGHIPGRVEELILSWDDGNTFSFDVEPFKARLSVLRCLFYSAFFETEPRRYGLWLTETTILLTRLLAAVASSLRMLTVVDGIFHLPFELSIILHNIVTVSISQYDFPVFKAFTILGGNMERLLPYWSKTDNPPRKDAFSQITKLSIDGWQKVLSQDETPWMRAFEKWTSSLPLRSLHISRFMRTTGRDCDVSALSFKDLGPSLVELKLEDIQLEDSFSGLLRALNNLKRLFLHNCLLRKEQDRWKQVLESLLLMQLKDFRIGDCRYSMTGEVEYRRLCRPKSDLYSDPDEKVTVELCTPFQDDRKALQNVAKVREERGVLPQDHGVRACDLDFQRE